MIETKNAIIESVSLSIADHGCLSGWLHLNYGGSGQGFGGHCLFKIGGEPGQSKDCAGHFITRCCEIAGVTEWQRIPGKSIRVRAEHRGIEAIGHITNDDWFNPSEDWKLIHD